MTEETNAAVVELPVVEGLHEASGRTTVEGVEYLQLVNAAAEIGYHPNYLGKLATKDGAIPAVRDTRKRLWFREDELEAFAQERAEQKEARSTNRGSGGGAGRKGYNKANYMPPKLRAYKTVLNDLRKEESIAADDKQVVIEWLEQRFRAGAAEFAAKRQAKEADEAGVEADAEADADFQNELQS